MREVGNTIDHIDLLILLAGLQTRAGCLDTEPI